MNTNAKLNRMPSVKLAEPIEMVVSISTRSSPKRIVSNRNTIPEKGRPSNRCHPLAKVPARFGARRDDRCRSGWEQGRSSRHPRRAKRRVEGRSHGIGERNRDMAVIRKHAIPALNELATVLAADEFPHVDQ